MNGKIWKALGIVVCMLALAAPHAMAETITHMVTADTHFADVVKNINASGVDDENVIELCADITLTGNHTLKRSTTIKSKDEDRKISMNGSNAGITVTGEGTVLNLGAKGYDKKLTIEGDTRVAFITVSEGATANMYENVTLQNRKFMGNACIVIMGSKSVFNMRGGVIKKCSRAVIADSGATVRMLGGKIEDCEVYGDGVILVHDNSKFIMEGGTISKCEAQMNNGGGLYADNSTITISGGTISGCKGRCVAVCMQQMVQPSISTAAQSADARGDVAAVCMQQMVQPSISTAAQSANVRHRQIMAAVCMRTIQPSTSAAAQSADAREYGAAVCMQKIPQPSKSAAAQSADVR